MSPRAKEPIATPGQSTRSKGILQSCLEQHRQAGCSIGNPGSSVVRSQREESVEMLRGESKALKPTVIVLVNAGYHEDIPRAAFCIGYDGPSAVIERPVVIDGQLY